MNAEENIFLAKLLNKELGEQGLQYIKNKLALVSLNRSELMILIEEYGNELNESRIRIDEGEIELWSYRKTMRGYTERYFNADGFKAIEYNKLLQCYCNMKDRAK